MTIVGLIHLIILAIPTLYLALRGSPKYYDFIVAVITGAALHWSYYNGECIISYFYKKIKNCDYKLGDTTTVEDAKVFNSYIIADILGITTVLSGAYMSYKLNYNVLLFFLIQYMGRKIDSGIIITFLSIFFLRTNKYLVPMFVLIIASSVIVKHKDQNCCLVGTQVQKDDLKSKPIK
jgi:hypothetical protein